MSEQNHVTIKVKRGVKVNLQEVDKLDNDRVLIAEAPKGLKLAIQQVDQPGAVLASTSKISMCG